MTERVTHRADHLGQEEPAHDWSDLGGLVLRAARRATATHLAESAARAGAVGRAVAGYEWGNVSLQVVE